MPSTTTSPPLSPRVSEKKSTHHARRRSGKDAGSAEKKFVRPAVLSRRGTPTRANSGRVTKERERESEDDGESFPQFCMTCEKQFLTADNTFLYCSEACRLHDLSPTSNTIASTYVLSPPQSPAYTRPFSSLSTAFSPADGPDIIPRFSPTISRPRSYFNSDPYPTSPLNQTSQSYNHSTTNGYESGSSSSASPSPSSSHKSNQHSIALASLRDLATALPKSSSRPSSKTPRPSHPSRSRTHDSNLSSMQTPPKSSSSSYISISRPGSAVWNYIPFTSTTSTQQSETPGSSYTKREEYSGYSTGGGNTVGAFGSTGGMGMDRPLPPRGGPGGYGHRPRSVDLVTPWVGYGGH